MIDALIIIAICNAFLFAYLLINHGKRDTEEELKESQKLFGVIIKSAYILMILFSVFATAKLSLDSGRNCQVLMINESTYYKYGNNFTGYHWDYDYTSAPNFANPNDPSSVFLFHEYKDYTYQEVCFPKTTKIYENYFEATTVALRLFILFIMLNLIWSVIEFLIGKVNGWKNKNG